MLKILRDLDGDAVGPVVGHRHGLRVALGLVVDAARADGVDVAPVLLGLRMDQWVAVDLGRGREQEPGALRLREPQRVEGTERADLERVDGMRQIVHRRRR